MAAEPAERRDEVPGDGLVLRPWDEDALLAMAEWGERGFPYNAFDMGFLREPRRLEALLSWVRDEKSHLHFAAWEGGRVVGRVSVNLVDEAGLYLWAVHVPPEHEGRGVCRRMLTALMDWLAAEHPGRDFVLSSNTFAERAHRAYFALGFEIDEVRWQYDRALAEAVWRVSHEERETIAEHLRFHNGRWEVRTHIMRRPSRLPALGDGGAARRGEAGRAARS
jgi:RimJ/RimL family protein N-acetyltransferase